MATEQTVFLEALDLPALARGEFLDRACVGDPALRRRVEDLLAAHERTGPFLDTPPMITGEDEDEGDDDLAFLRPEGGGPARLGRHLIKGLIGRGGHGIVLSAFDEKLHRPVAIKVMAPGLAATSPPRRRFLREARAAAAVTHEHVVAIHAVEEEPIPYLVMEFVDGETLQQRMDRIGPLPPAEVARIGAQIARGLHAAHETGLVHRDVKPANVLLQRGRDHVKLTDFGLARATDDASVTHSGAVLGTPLYMSPEQAAGGRVDFRSDLFSLGSTLYAMLTGRPPFRADSALAVLRRLAEDTPRPIPEIIPEAPPRLVALIAELHAKAPADRPSSAAAVADRLDGRDGPDPFATPRRRGRRRLLVAAVGALLLLGLLGAAESTGVSDLRGTIIRLWTPTGTLVIESDDPGIVLTLDGEGVLIEGAGVREIRLKPGEYAVKATRDGTPVRQELVRVERNGRQVVRIAREPLPTSPIEQPVGFRALTGAKIEEMRRWADSLPGNYRPRWVAFRTHGFELVVDAVADKSSSGVDWQILTFAEDPPEDHWGKMTSQYRPASGIACKDRGHLALLQLWIADGADWEYWFGSHDFIDGKLRQGLTFKDGPPVAGVATWWLPRSITAHENLDGSITYGLYQGWLPYRGCEFHPELTPAELAAQVARYRELGWRLHLIYPFSRGEETRFLAAFVDDPARAPWRFTPDLTEADYREELDHATERGWRPRCVCSRISPGGGRVLYTVVWDGPGRVVASASPITPRR